MENILVVAAVLACMLVPTLIAILIAGRPLNRADEEFDYDYR